MKREREGGGKDQAEEGLGARSGQDTLSPTRFLRPQRRWPTKVQRRSARQGHLRALTLVSLALEGPEVQTLTKGNNLSARKRGFTAHSGPVYNLVCKITGRIVVT